MTASPPVQYLIGVRANAPPDTWNASVLTMDPVRQVIYVSCPTHPEEYCHRRMDVKEVRVWPDYKKRAINEDHDSAAAKLTFCATGLQTMKTTLAADKGKEGHGTAPPVAEAGKGEHDKGEQLSEKEREKKEKEARKAAKHAAMYANLITPPLTADDIAPPSLEDQLKNGVFAGETEETWVMRCNSAEQLHQIVESFKQLGFVGRPADHTSVGKTK